MFSSIRSQLPCDACGTFLIPSVFSQTQHFLRLLPRDVNKQATKKNNTHTHKQKPLIWFNSWNVDAHQSCIRNQPHKNPSACSWRTNSNLVKRYFAAVFAEWASTPASFWSDLPESMRVCTAGGFCCFDSIPSIHLAVKRKSPLLSAWVRDLYNQQKWNHLL